MSLFCDKRDLPAAAKLKDDRLRWLMVCNTLFR